MKTNKLKVLLATTFCIICINYKSNSMESKEDQPISTISYAATTESLRIENGNLKNKIYEIVDELFGAKQEELARLIAPHFPRDGWLEVIKCFYNAGFSSNGESHVNWKFQDVPYSNWSQDVHVRYGDIVNWSCGCGCEGTRISIQQKNWEEVKVPHNMANRPFNKMLAIYGEFFKDIPAYHGKYVII